MIRITKIADTATTTILNVAGKIVGQDITEIEKICLEKLEQDKEIFLNFNDVTFVDKHSAMAIRKLMQMKIKICNGSLYIQTLIERVK